MCLIRCNRTMMTAEALPLEEEYTLFVYEEELINDLDIKEEPNFDSSPFIDNKYDSAQEATTEDSSISNCLPACSPLGQNDEIKEETLDIEENDVKWTIDEPLADTSNRFMTQNSEQKEDLKESLLINWDNLKTKVSRQLYPQSPINVPPLEEIACRNVNRILKKSEIEDLRKAEMRENRPTNCYIRSVEKPAIVEKKDDKLMKKNEENGGGSCEEFAKSLRAKVVKIVNSHANLSDIVMTRQRKRELIASGTNLDAQVTVKEEPSILVPPKMVVSPRKSSFDGLPREKSTDKLIANERASCEAQERIPLVVIRTKEDSKPVSETPSTKTAEARLQNSLPIQNITEYIRQQIGSSAKLTESKPRSSISSKLTDETQEEAMVSNNISKPIQNSPPVGPSGKLQSSPLDLRTKLHSTMGKSASEEANRGRVSGSFDLDKTNQITGKKLTNHERISMPLTRAMAQNLAPKDSKSRNTRIDEKLEKEAMISIQNSSGKVESPSVLLRTKILHPTVEKSKPTSTVPKKISFTPEMAVTSAETSFLTQANEERVTSKELTPVERAMVQNLTPKDSKSRNRKIIDEKLQKKTMRSMSIRKSVQNSSAVRPSRRVESRSVVLGTKVLIPTSENLAKKNTFTPELTVSSAETSFTTQANGGSDSGFVDLDKRKVTTKELRNTERISSPVTRAMAQNLTPKDSKPHHNGQSWRVADSNSSDLLKKLIRDRVVMLEIPPSVPKKNTSSYLQSEGGIETNLDRFGRCPSNVKYLLSSAEGKKPPDSAKKVAEEQLFREARGTSSDSKSQPTVSNFSVIKNDLSKVFPVETVSSVKRRKKVFLATDNIIDLTSDVSKAPPDINSRGSSDTKRKSDETLCPTNAKKAKLSSAVQIAHQNISETSTSRVSDRTNRLFLEAASSDKLTTKPYSESHPSSFDHRRRSSRNTSSRNLEASLQPATTTNVPISPSKLPVSSRSARTSKWVRTHFSIQRKNEQTSVHRSNNYNPRDYAKGYRRDIEKRNYDSKSKPRNSWH